MKNQKFFFSVIAVLFVLGVFALFFFGFKSRVFANVGVVGLVSKQVVVDNRGVVVNAVAGHVVNEVTDKVHKVPLNAANLVVARVRDVRLSVLSLKVAALQV